MNIASNITTSELSASTNVPPPTIAYWIDKGYLTPAKRGVGSGYNHIFSMRDGVAVAVGRDLRGRGFPISTSAAAMQWILSNKLTWFEKCFRDGRTLMLVVGNSILPVLANHDEVYSNPALDIVAASTTGVPVAVIDLQRAFLELNKRILAHRAGTNQKGNPNQLGSHPVEKREVPA